MPFPSTVNHPDRTGGPPSSHVHRGIGSSFFGFGWASTTKARANLSGTRECADSDVRTNAVRDIDARYRSKPVRVFRPIGRPRLYARLLAAARYRIITVVAPAGFGKSVALRHFVRRRPRTVLYEVSQDTTSLLQFVRGFCDALSRHTPALRGNLPSAFEGFASSTTPGEDLASWAFAHLREMKLLIVIDNLDTERDPEISRFLLTLIDRTKSNIRWCLASRSRLDLPTASWLAYNDSDLCIDANDLRFTFDEARLGAQAAGADISDEDLRTMFRLTEGWPAALAFAFRSTTKARDLQSAAHGTREMVYRYLAEQVWGSLNSDLRDFLSIAAFLPWIDARFAAEAGYPDSDTLVENLRYHIGLLSTSREGTYELHDLFRGFIRQTLTMRGRSALEEALSRAAEVLERSGLTAAALERYIDANATPSIARLINVHNVALLETGHYDTAQRALRTLEGPELGWSGVLALRAAIEEASGRVDRGRYRFQ